MLGELKDAATRSVLRAVDESKCVCGQGSAPNLAREAQSVPPEPLAGFGEENGEEQWKGLEMETETKGEGRGWNGI